MPDNREYRLNNLGELEQYLGDTWITVQTAKARENNDKLPASDLNPPKTS